MGHTERFGIIWIRSFDFALSVCCWIYMFENEAQPDKILWIPASMWWAVATLTTVGYGDLYPITLGGRVFTAVVTLLGIGIIAIPTSLVTNALSKAKKRTRKEGET